MVKLEEYRHSDSERARTADLLRLLPRDRKSVLDIGARDGHFSRLLTEYFESVTALDLHKPSFEYSGVTNVAGDVTRLQFEDSSFDCVFCAEVLEHIPDLDRACREIARVARHEIVIGVPFKQDTRLGRTTCRECGKPNPPWGHVNSFDEARLSALFSGLSVKAKSFVGSSKSASNPIASLLMDLAGNPYGTYSQDEPCIHCGATLLPPQNSGSFALRICSALAVRINAVQMLLTRSHGNWIHLVFAKGGAR